MIKRIALGIACMFAVCALPVQADQSLAGVWNGVLNVPNDAPLPLVLHFSSAGRGLTATIDVPTTGTLGSPVDSVTVSDTTISMTINTPQFSKVSFMGVLRNGAITGWWSQGSSNLPVSFLSPAAESLPGTWHGVLTASSGGHSIPIELHITGSGLKLAATVDDPTDNILGMPVSGITLNGTTLSFSIDNEQIHNGSFSGTLGKGTITGDWTVQGGANFLVTASKVP